MNDRGFNSEPGIRSLGVFSQLWLRVTNRFHGYVYPKRGDELSSLLINIPTFTKFPTNFDVFTSSNRNAFTNLPRNIYYRETSITIKKVSVSFSPGQEFIYTFVIYTRRFLLEIIIYSKDLDPLFQVYRLK